MLRSAYVPHNRVTVDFGDQLITKQSMAAECDINNILKQFSKTGIISHINKNSAQYMDLPSDLDFQSSIAIIESANASFASLPSKIREFFRNDPGRFLAALQDPSQRDHLVELGVLKAPAKPSSAGPESPAAASSSAASGGAVSS